MYLLLYLVNGKMLYLRKINDRISKLSKLYTKFSVDKKTLTCTKFLADLHDKYVIAPADKASNNIFFM